MHPSANSLFDLAGRRALVTGGSRGLGLSIARGLAQAGASVAVASRQAPPESAGLVHLPADLSIAAQRAGLIDRAAAVLGGDSADGVDILVHAAGQQHRAPAEDFPIEQWQAIMDLHVTAAFELSQQAARRMLPRGRGKIILISSIIGFQGGYSVPAYAAAKHAIIGLVQSLCNEWAGRGINVNALAPGYFAAGLGQAVLDDPVRGPQIRARIPAGRAGEPGELVGPAIFLASGASDFMHGQTLVIDGGWLSR